MATDGLILPGQEALVASWQALARLSSGARLIRSPDAVAAVFPAWAPLNNAIGLAAHDRAAATVASLRGVYAAAGVDAWAFWVPSGATDVDSPDTVRDVDGLTRDTTTLVMATDLRPGLGWNEGVVRTSIAAAIRAAGDEPIAETELDNLDDVPDLSGWVMVQDGMAVAGAWSILHDGDCGIYTVGTLPQWRRRSLAKALLSTSLPTPLNAARGPRRCSRPGWASRSTSRSASNPWGATRSGCYGLVTTTSTDDRRG